MTDEIKDNQEKSVCDKYMLRRMRDLGTLGDKCGLFSFGTS
jgi:hypothetical protein